MFPNPVAGVIHPASWVRPSGNLDFEVTSSFGPRRITVDGKILTTTHNGLDIGNGRAGAPVLAQGAGRVFEYRPTVDGVVTIQTANGWRLVTAHMTNIQVRLGQAVTVGQRLGNVGNVGVSSAAHLHFENKQLVNGIYVPRDPWLLLSQNGTLPDTGTGDDMSTLVLPQTIYPIPRTCLIAAGAKVDGWNSTSLVKSQTWPSGSNFPTDCTVTIDQTPNKPPEGTFYRCTAGVYAGLFIPIGQVTLAPPPPDPIAAAYNRGLADAENAVVAVPEK